nr:unnamed protein product [Callosobruchus analis]
MKIQGVATCQYLCMASCGFLYGSREFSDECVFNETIEQSNYNIYSSTKYSNQKRTFYLALNRRGQSKKVVLKARSQLGRLSSYTRVLTRNVAPELQLHPMRHHAHQCPGTTHQSQKVRLHTQRCPKKRKRKKKKRKCDPEFELPNAPKKAQTRNNKCDDSKDSEVCQRDVTSKKKHKLSHSEIVRDKKKKNKNKKGVRRRLELDQTDMESTTTTVSPMSTTSIDMDEDYGFDSSTHHEWDESTTSYNISTVVPDANVTAPSLKNHLNLIRWYCAVDNVLRYSES